MCESDGVVLTGLAAEPENASNKVEDRRGLPDQFKTVQGKTVKLIGTQHSQSPVLVSYSTSKLQGNALLLCHSVFNELPPNAIHTARWLPIRGRQGDCGKYLPLCEGGTRSDRQHRRIL